MYRLPTLRRRHRRAVPLRHHAADDLRFIRETMERASSLTAFPGLGLVGVGATALVAALVAARAPNATAWLGTWLAEAVLAIAIGSAAMAFKSRAAGMQFWTRAWRRFALSFSLAMAAAALLTVRLHQVGWHDALPGMWMLLYGVGVASGGAFSVAPVRVMGYAFMALGAAALLAPAGGSDAWMAAGFGGLHLAFGAWIARRHGG